MIGRVLVVGAIVVQNEEVVANEVAIGGRGSKGDLGRLIDGPCVFGDTKNWLIQKMEELVF